MSLQARLAAVVSRVAKEFNEVRDAGGINRRLAPFHLALAGQKNQFCNVVVIGDSVSEGAVTTNPLDGRWQGVFAKALRDEPGGEGYLPVWFASPFVTNPATFSHTPVNAFGATGSPPVKFDEGASSIGLASRRIGLQKSGWVEWTFIGDQVRVWYDTTDFFALSGKVFIDGVEKGIIGGGGTPSPMMIWDSPVLSRGKHTIRIQETDNLGGEFWVEAVQFFDSDLTKGVHVYDAAHSGATAAYFMNASHPWPSAIQKVTPSLVIIMLGFNDSTEVTPAQFLVNLRAVIARVRAKLTDGTYTLAVVAPWAPKPEPAAGWDAYVASMETAAAEHPNGVLVRVGDRWPTMVQGANNPGMFGNDTVHPAESGQRLLGLYLADALGLPGRVNQASSMPRKLETTFIGGPGPNWFTTEDSWTIPEGATHVDIDICAPGSGGGSGRRGAAGGIRCGGGGGSSGARALVTVRLDALPAGTTKLHYSIPSPGSGGAAVTVDNTNGNNGGNPSSPTFVSLVAGSTTPANLIAYSSIATTSGGRGGTATAGAGGAATISTINGTAGGAASTAGGNGAAGGSNPNDVGGGGGAGGGLTAANAASNGGAGGYYGGLYPTTTGATGGVATGTRPGQDKTAVGPYPTPNAGGGGGASHATLAAGDGGDGGDFGGGGGGGGSSVNGQVSGEGGNGGRGYIRFTARF